VASLVVNTFRQSFLEALHHSLQHVGRNCCHFFPDVLFQVYHCHWFLFVHLALEISSEEEVLRLGTLSFRSLLKCRRNILWVTTTESLFFKIVSTTKTRCSTDQCSMATEMLWVSLEGRSRTNSPRQRFHSQLYCKIVRYFCRKMYEAMATGGRYHSLLERLHESWNSGIFLSVLLLGNSSWGVLFPLFPSPRSNLPCCVVLTGTVYFWAGLSAS